MASIICFCCSSSSPVPQGLKAQASAPTPRRRPPSLGNATKVYPSTPIIPRHAPRVRHFVRDHAPPDSPVYRRIPFIRTFLVTCFVSIATLSRLHPPPARFSLPQFQPWENCAWWWPRFKEPPRSAFYAQRLLRRRRNTEAHRRLLRQVRREYR